MSKASPVLEVRRLSVAFGKSTGRRTVAEDISFRLFPGKTLGIVGESGSGKTISSLAIMQLLPPGGSVTSGEIWFSRGGEQPQNLLSLTSSGMRGIRGRHISMIFQEPMTSLNPVVRCGRQVAEVLKLHLGMSPAGARERTLELFREVKLPRPEKMYRSYPHQLSGGQKQRVMIAMAMACKPALLIADEPTTALDVTVQRAILELMRELTAKYHMALIFITHDLGVIRQIADEVLVMKEGAVVEKGPVAEVFGSPEHPYTKGLMACRPGMGSRPARLRTVRDFLRQHDETEVMLTPAVKASMTREQRQEKMYAGEPLLVVEGLRTWFSASSGWGRKKDFVKAVDDVSLNVYPGETLGLVGESGSGKTTLGRTLLRLVRENGGRILYRGQDITRPDPSQLRGLRKQMQIIFQDPYSSLNPRIPVGYAIMEPMKVHGLQGTDRQRREKTMALLERVGLEPVHFHRYPHEFSGGQRQRIGIARALAVEPEFIVCDESVSALDVSVQAQVLNLLNDLKEEFGLTYVFISHDLSVVRYMSDRIVVLRDGRIVEEGEADALCDHPSESYTRELISAIPR